jgi:hypothetical protein
MRAKRYALHSIHLRLGSSTLQFAGFVIHGYLGGRTLFTKSVGLAFSVASGLTLGKEGPFVHIASCIGNIVSRFFTKYENNEGAHISCKRGGGAESRGREAQGNSQRGVCGRRRRCVRCADRRRAVQLGRGMPSFARFESGLSYFSKVSYFFPAKVMWKTWADSMCALLLD